MAPTRFTSVDWLGRLLIVIALSCLLALTLVDRGATRMYATPWTALLWVAQLTPIVLLLFRALSSGTQTLPSAPWRNTTAFFVLVVLASALLSPFRGTSVLVATTALSGAATFLLLHDWLAKDQASNLRRLLVFAGVASVIISLTSLVEWAVFDFSDITTLTQFFHRLQARNEHPLGHSNYTAGLALLALPWPAVLALRTRGSARLKWSLLTLLPVAMLFTSASRGGLLGIAAMALVALWQSRLSRREIILCLVALALAGVALAYAHPRTRDLLFHHLSDPTPNLSTVQRASMAKAGWLMGRSHPVLGWGLGATPYVFPRYRWQLDGGVENAYQLHSTPVQLWAELGAGGIGAALALLVIVGLAAARVRRTPWSDESTAPRTAAVIALGGYGAFALTDYQLDVPVFTFAVAVCLASLAPTASLPASSWARRGMITLGILVLTAIALVGRPDPTPEINVRALSLGADPAKADAAIALLEESLARYPDQEIAHFNLGWLLIVRDPRAAETHFAAAAHLVPDKGGVYFGLALARLNQEGQRQPNTVVRALALECLNDPGFLISPWWQQPALKELRGATLTQLQTMAKVVADRLARTKDYRVRDAEYLPVLANWLDGHAKLAEVLAVSRTSERVTYFAARPLVPAWANAPIVRYRRERPAYPILMRNLDLPPPVDLYDVQENSMATRELAMLFPAKGWLPGPVLIELLEEHAQK